MSLRNIILFIVVLLSAVLRGQEEETLMSKAQVYEIGGIEVTGAKRHNKETILASSGLSVGDVITIPSEKFGKIIHKLWDYRLFSDVDIYIKKVEGNKVFLELAIVEIPVLTEIKVEGEKKKKADQIIKDANLNVNLAKVNESLIAKTKNYLVNKYKKDGYFSTKVDITTTVDPKDVNGVKMVIKIDKGKKQKIESINFDGNEKYTDAKLRKQLKKTKQKSFFRFWKRSKYIDTNYREDLVSLVDFYKENGYRDARVVSDSVYNDDKQNLTINIKVEEGRKYYFGDIKFLGNTVYKNEILHNVLGVKKGDVYNGVQLKKRTTDQSPDATSIANMYQNNGYLFSQIMPVETSVVKDTINFEVRIHEGKLAHINNVQVNGNTVTKDKVIYREIRTRPGQVYSKDDIIRSIRELSQLGFFDNQKISPQIKNPDPNNGTVEVHYDLDDQISTSTMQLQGGYGAGQGFVGTLGLSVANFSLQNIFNPKAYKPFPLGDGQKLSLNLSASRSWRSFNFSFMEPWMGGEKPVQFSVSFQNTKVFSYNYFTYDVDKSKYFLLTGISVGMAKRLSVPDDYFQLSQSLEYKHYNLHNYYNTGLFTFGDGTSNSLNYEVSLSRRSSGPNPIYPMGGSDFSVTFKTTLPTSLWNGIDYKKLAEERVAAVADKNKKEVGRIDQERFRWLEFYKIKGSAAWYINLIDKLVLKAGTEMGYLGAYNSDRGVVPFERFFIGGDGMAYYAYDGREYVQLRGYPNQSLSSQDGDVIYNKFSAELRYPITLKPMTSIYGLAFAEAGNSFSTYSDFNPFKVKRSAGVGIRIFTAYFGLIGFDFGYGFDDAKNVLGERHGWETHFIMGANL